jgi:seryl-tRNA synthetase
MPAPKLPFRSIALILAAICITLPACKSRQAQNEKLQRQWNAKTKEAADLLATVKDVPTAKAAEPKLKAVLQELNALGSQLDESYDPENVPASESEKMTKEVAEGIAETQRLNAETLRISKSPEVVAALGETWRKLPSVFLLEASGAIPKGK